MKRLNSRINAMRSRQLGGGLKALVVLAAMAMVNSAFSMTETSNGIEWTYTDDGTYATITAIGAIAPENDGFVNVPGTLGTYTVTTIGDGTFENCTDMTGVELPSSVTIIGKYAFRGCANLESASMSTYVTDIGNEAFKGCTSLTSVDIPYNATSMGTSVFEGCTALETAGFTGNVSSIPSQMFKNCTSLKNVRMWMISLVSIEDEAFRGCTALESFEVREDVTTIGARVFHSCSALKEVTIWSKGTTDIGTGAFYDAGLVAVYVAEGMTATVKGKLLTSGLDVDAKGVKVKEISDVKYWTDTAVSPNVTWAYRTIGEATEVNKEAEIYDGGGTAIAPSDFIGPLVVPGEIEGNTVTRIGERALSYCPYLTSVTIPNGVTSIGSSAFSGCAELESVAIPNGVTSIGDSAFCDCSLLKNVAIPNGVTSIEGQVFYNCSALESVEIPDSVTSIGNSAFSYCSALESVVIPDGVKEIGDSAFYSCDVLGSAVIGDGVKHIGDSAFYFCTGLTDLTIGSGVISIGSYAFSGCSGLTEISIPATVTAIGDSAFAYCDNLESVSIPDSVTSVGTEAFMGCNKLAEATLGDGMTNIPEGMFSDCALTSVEIPYSVKSIGGNAFRGCALTSVIIPYGVTSIGASAFEGCTSLADAIIPSTATTIENCAFKDCALTCVEIPAGVTSIGAQMFSGCTSLRVFAVAEPSNVKTIGAEAFSGCTSLEYAEIPDGVTEIGVRAFEDCSALTSVSIPSSVTSIDTDAFAGTALSTVFVEDMVRESDVTIMLSGSGFDTSGITFVRADATPPYMVSFYGNGGDSAVSSKTVYDGYAIGALPSATRTGYTFLGWFTASEGGSEISETTIVNGDVTYFAHWSPKSYTFTFDANGGEDGWVKVMNYGEALTAPTVKWEGHTFVSWSPEVPATVPAEDATYVAQWTVNKYKITFDANGGTGGWAKDMNYGATLTAPTVTKAGYTFTGWSPEVPAAVPAKDATYVAQWSPKSYTITFDANGGDGGWANNMNCGETLTKPTVKWEGHTFAGWSPEVPTTVPAENATYVAQWTVNKYNITFDANGGEGGWTSSMNFGEALTKPTVKWEGHTFTGWSPEVPSAVPASDATYVAQWTVNICTAVFLLNLDDASLAEASRKVNYGEQIGVLPTPTSPSHTFVGWFTAAEGGEPISSTTTVTVDELLCYAHWTANDSGGGSGEGGGDPVSPDPVNPDPVNPDPDPVSPDPADPVLPDPISPDPVSPDPVSPDPVPPCFEYIDENDIVAPYDVPKAVVLQGAAYNGCDVVGIVELKLGKVNAKKGTGKVSGSFTGLDGKKHTIKGPKLEGINGTAPVAVSLEVKGVGTLSVKIGGEKFAGSLGPWHVQSAEVGGNWTGRGATVTVDADNLSMFAGEVLEDLLPNDEQATASGGKWSFSKAASVKWAKPKGATEKTLIVDTSKGKTNLSGIKLTYTLKKGTFKGSFKVYALEGAGAKTKLKKYTVKVNGVVVGGVGYGAATSKKPVLSWSVTVR